MDRTFFRFVTIQAFDKRMDRQKDGQAASPDYPALHLM